jgi:hypothetical protein
VPLKNKYLNKVEFHRTFDKRERRTEVFFEKKEGGFKKPGFRVPKRTIFYNFFHCIFFGNGVPKVL